MGHRMKMVLLAFLVTLASATLAQAAATKFTDVQCRNITVTGTLTSGGCTCTNISTTTLNAADVNATYGVTGATATFTSETLGSLDTNTASLTGLLTLGSDTAYSVKVSSITAAIPTGTPTAAGLIAFDKSYVLYVSTGTGPGAWVKVGGQ